MVPRSPFQKLPHKYRSIPVRVITLAVPAVGVSFLFAAAIISVVQFGARMPQQGGAETAILRRPYDVARYISAAMLTDPTLSSTRASYYTQLGADVAGTDIPSVLGVSSLYTSTLKKRQTDTDSAQQQFDGWVAVTRRYPDYSDGYVRAAYYALKLNRYEEAAVFVDDALALSPFSPSALQLRARIPHK